MKITKETLKKNGKVLAAIGLTGVSVVSCIAAIKATHSPIGVFELPDELKNDESVKVLLEVSKISSGAGQTFTARLKPGATLQTITDAIKEAIEVGTLSGKEVPVGMAIFLAKDK